MDSAYSPKRDNPLTPPPQQNSEVQASLVLFPGEGLFKGVDDQLASREIDFTLKTFNIITSPVQAALESAYLPIDLNLRSSPQLADTEIQTKKAKVASGSHLESPNDSLTPKGFPKTMDIIDLTSDDDDGNGQQDLEPAKNVPAALASPESTLQKNEITVIDLEDDEQQLLSPTPEIVAPLSRARDVTHGEQLRLESPSSQEESASITSDLLSLAEPVLSQPAILLSRPTAKASTHPISAQYLEGRAYESDSQKLGDTTDLNFQAWHKDVRQFRLQPWQREKLYEVFKHRISPDIAKRDQVPKELGLDSGTIGNWFYRKVKRDRGEDNKGAPREGPILTPPKQLERERETPKRATQTLHSSVQLPRLTLLNDNLPVGEGLLADNQVIPITPIQASPITCRGDENVEESVLKPPNRDFIKRFQEARHREDSAAEVKAREGRKLRIRNQKISMRKPKPALCSVKVSKKRKTEYMDDFNYPTKSKRVSYEDDSKMERDDYDISNLPLPTFERLPKSMPSLRSSLSKPMSMRDALRLDEISLSFDRALNSVIDEILKDENEERGIEEMIPKNNNMQVLFHQNSSQDVGQVRQTSPSLRLETPSTSSIVATSARSRKLPSFTKPNSRMVNINIKGQTFAVYLDWISYHSPILAGDCYRFPITPEVLREVEPDVFGLFVQWMYSAPHYGVGLINERGHPAYQHRLMRLWILAKTLNIPRLQNSVIDALEARRQLGIEQLETKSLKFVYENTEKGDMLRSYLMHVYSRNMGRFSEEVVKERFPLAMKEEIKEEKRFKIEDEESMEGRVVNTEAYHVREKSENEDWT